MATPLPRPGTENLDPPDLEQARFIAQGIASACRLDDGVTELQSLVLGALCRSMTGHEVDITTLAPISAANFATGLARRNEMFRTRLVQLMELGHMVLPAPDVAVADRVIEFATELSVANDCVYLARELAEGSRQLVAADFDRNRYLMNLDLSGFTPLRTEDDKAGAWTNTAVNDTLANRWRALSRPVTWPGRPESSTPILVTSTPRGCRNGWPMRSDGVRWWRGASTSWLPTSGLCRTGRLRRSVSTSVSSPRAISPSTPDRFRRGTPVV